MNINEFRKMRLWNQRLAGNSDFKKPADVVAWLGAMQAQTLEMAKWGIGVRLPGATAKTINAALNTGKIIRMHILRPTWHFVAAKDIHWMNELARPALQRAYLSYGKQLGLHETALRKGVDILVDELSGGGHYTAEEIGTRLRQRGAKAAHYAQMVMFCAEAEGLLCNGKLIGSKQTFTLLQEWAPKKKTLSREEALVELAKRFFTSHAPATLEDFVWWSGLKISECRQAVEGIERDFVSDAFHDRTFWLPRRFKRPPETDTPSALLLPPFDEFVVSYTHRSEIVKDAYYHRVMTKNGLFSPTLMREGEVIGKWRKTTVKSAAKIEMDFFQKISKSLRAAFEAEAARVTAFYTV